MAQKKLATLDGIIDQTKVEHANALLIANLSQGKEPNEEILYRSVRRKVLYFENMKFWWGNFSEEDYFWNTFGLGEVESSTKFNEVCNVNYSKGGKESNHAGLFAKDRLGNIYLVHDGTFHNGTLPVIENEYIPNIIDVRINNAPYKYFLVANISSKNLHEDIFQFINGVSNYKSFRQSISSN